jgi:hypothetical protein
MDLSLDSVLGPFEGKVYCNYFYVLMILSFLVLLGGVVALLGDVLKNKMKNGTVLLFVLVNNFLMYFNVRLVYSMCMNSM